jgi:hypothetical protein
MERPEGLCLKYLWQKGVELCFLVSLN